MGYQALLFCPDEKLARVVSQVFSELDFIVDPVHEPFAAVKQLMAHRYDAVVVDCENEQNASLLFRSARNSSFNQSSLAFALVEGQTGVAKAYRIGANLVLTKPINVEQAKGTLRVARGLLRKSTDAAAANAVGVAGAAKAAPPVIASKAAAVASNSSESAAMVDTATKNAPTRRSGWKEFPNSSAANLVASTSATASAKHEDNPVVDWSPVAGNATSIAPEPAAEVALAKSSVESRNDVIGDQSGDSVAKSDAEQASSFPPAPSAQSALASARGTGAAAAPAKEVQVLLAKESKTVAAKRASPLRAKSAKTAALRPALDSAQAADGPTFGTLGQQDSTNSERNKKIMIAAVIVLALAALGYLTEGKLVSSSTTQAPQPASRPQSSAKPAPALAPMPSSVAALSTTKPDTASSSTSTADLQTAAAPLPNKPSAGLGNSGVMRIAANFASNLTANIAGHLRPETKKQESLTGVTNSSAATSGTRPQSEEPAPSLPSTLTVASATDRNLSSLMSSASLNVSRPALATLRVSQGVSQGLLIKRVQPQYPPAALAIHAQGAVLIEATVNKEGNVINPKVLKGDPVLARAAVEAVRQWRYKPYYLDGDPVEIQTQITINFKAN